jgi:hypothetical protein
VDGGVAHEVEDDGDEFDGRGVSAGEGDGHTLGDCFWGGDAGGEEAELVGGVLGGGGGGGRSGRL